MFRQLFVRGALGGLGVAGFCALSLVSCANDHEEIARPVANDPASSGDTPPIPTIDFVRVSEDSIFIEWSVTDDTGVASYTVYRASLESPERELASGVTEPAYADGEVRVGQTYQYRVASVLTNGLEGQKSESSVASPAVFAVTIDGGAEFTRRDRVTLTMTAPGATTNMRISEMPDLSDEPWITFAAGFAFDLEAGPDGERTVYTQFRDSAGSESPVVSDNITLDTIAEIERVTQDAGSATVPPGTTVRFTVETNEPGGSATIDIGEERFGIRLFDDGTQGDGAADDGIYTVDYELPSNFEVSDAEITGRFTDAAGNGAEPRVADDLLTVSTGPSDPLPVRVTLIATSTVSVTIGWDESPEADFDRYDVLRSQEATPSDFQFLDSITNQAITEYFDTSFTAPSDSTFFFYKVAVFDNEGRSAESNVLTVEVGP